MDNQSKLKNKRNWRILIKKFPIWLNIILIVIVVFSIRVFDRKGSSSLHKCNCMKQGIRKEELIKELGNPIKTMNEDRNELLIFESSIFAAGPIRARIEKNTRNVIMLKCYEDFPPKWNLGEDKISEMMNSKE